MPKEKFSDLKFSNWLLHQLKCLNLEYPTPVQLNCIPAILDGKDCIGAAKTGSGKTLAFALPILQRLSEDPYGIFALVLTPTRELAYQMKDTFDAVGKAINLRVAVVVGGENAVEQQAELEKRPHVVIASPGRLCQMIQEASTFSFKRLKFLVLDEADRMLGGEYDDVLKPIFGVLSKTKQTLLFSATITDALIKVKDIIPGEVFFWEEKAERATVDHLEEFFVLCPRYAKDGYLVETLRTYFDDHADASIIIFVDSCKNCQSVSDTLNNVGFTNVSLHSVKSQKTRISGLSQFKSRHVKMLVSTDVASRGLDIPEVDLVINYSIPLKPKDYIHRVGRTARAGKGGWAISLVTPRDVPRIQAIEAATHKKMTEFKIKGAEVAKIFTQVSVTRREAEVRISNDKSFKRRETHKNLKLIKEGKDPEEELRKLKRKKKKRLLKKNRVKAGLIGTEWNISNSEEPSTSEGNQ